MQLRASALQHYSSVGKTRGISAAAAGRRRKGGHTAQLSERESDTADTDSGSKAHDATYDDGHAKRRAAAVYGEAARANFKQASH